MGGSANSKVLLFSILVLLGRFQALAQNDQSLANRPIKARTRRDRLPFRGYLPSPPPPSKWVI